MVEDATRPYNDDQDSICREPPKRAIADERRGPVACLQVNIVWWLAFEDPWVTRGLAVSLASLVLLLYLLMNDDRKLRVERRVKDSGLVMKPGVAN